MLVAVAARVGDAPAADPFAAQIGSILAGTEVVIVAAADAVLAAPVLAAVRAVGAGGWRTALYLDEHLAEHVGAGGAVPPALAEFCGEVFGGQPVVVAAG